jgi:uncharacterized protein YqjF (DUF2071 family)
MSPGNDFDRSFLEETAHRPWPLPGRPWIMTQSWHDLLFAHWPVEPALLAGRIPGEFPLDVHEGRAWLGVIPFHMTNVAPRGVPAFPWVSAFPELNVRTYVTLEGRPGIYFFSLDAGNSIAAATARVLFHLPYFTAEMSVSESNGSIRYSSRRSSRSRPAEFVACYAPAGPVHEPEPGTLEYFLTERYCLYTHDGRGRRMRLDIHHRPWPLQPARLEVTANTMAAAAGIHLPDTAPLLHFSKRQDMVAWPLERF